MFFFFVSLFFVDILQSTERTEDVLPVRSHSTYRYLTTDEVEITPFLKQLRRDFFSQEERLSKKRAFAYFLVGGANAHIISNIFANDQLTGKFIFKVSPGKLLLSPYLCSLLLTIPTELKHADISFKTIRGWYEEEREIRRKKRVFAHVMTKLITFCGAGYFAYSLANEFIEVGRSYDRLQGKELAEFWCLSPFFIPQAFAKGLRAVYPTINGLSSFFSRKSSSLIEQHRSTILKKLSRTYLMIDSIPIAQLLETAKYITKLSTLAQRGEQNDIILMPLLHGFYHADAEEQFHVRKFSHPTGYKVAQGLGILAGLTGAYGMLVASKFVIGLALGYAYYDESDKKIEIGYYQNNTNLETTFLNFSAVAVGLGYFSLSATKQLRKTFSDIYCYFSGYDPNKTRLVLDRQEKTLPIVRGVTSSLSLLASSVLSLSSMWNAYIALHIGNTEEEISRLSPLLFFTALNFGSLLNATYGNTLQHLITSSFEFSRFRGRKKTTKFKDLEGQLRSSIQNMLVNTSQYVESLPDEKIEALWTFLQMPPSVLKETIKRSLGMPYDASVFRTEELREDAVELHPTPFTGEEVTDDEEDDANTDTENEEFEDIDRILDDTMDLFKTRDGFMPEVVTRPAHRQSEGFLARIRGFFSWNTNNDAEETEPLLATQAHDVLLGNTDDTDELVVDDLHQNRQPSLFRRVINWCPSWWHNADDTTEQELTGMAEDEEERTGQEFVDPEAGPNPPTLAERLADWWYNRNYWYRKY